MALGPLGQIHISVTDVDRSVAFYRDVLGVPHLFTVPGQPMAFFASGEVRLYLGVPESKEFRSHCVLYFRVDDIDAEVARLTSLGVTFADKPHVVHRDGTMELWMAGLNDPDGHHIILMQERNRPRWILTVYAEIATTIGLDPSLSILELPEVTGGVSCTPPPLLSSLDEAWTRRLECGADCVACCRLRSSSGRCARLRP